GVGVRRPRDRGHVVLRGQPRRVHAADGPRAVDHDVHRRWRKNSRLPEAPVMGDGVIAIRYRPIAAAAAVTPAIAASWISGSVTTPPRPTSSRPASNCGLTSAP